MAIARVQDIGNNTAANGATLAATWGSNTVSGHCIVVVVMKGNSSAINSVTDSQGNTYTLISNTWGGSGANTFATYYAKNITGGTTPTITVNFGAPTGAAAAFAAREYSGVDTVNPVNVTVTGSALSGVPTSGNMTTTLANTMIVGFYGGATGTAETAGSGFSNYYGQNNGTNGVGIEEKAAATTGVYSAVFGTSLGAGWQATAIALAPPSTDQLSTDSMAFSFSGGGATVGYKKVYVGGVWTKKPVKVYVGGSWVVKPTKTYKAGSWTSTS